MEVLASEVRGFDLSGAMIGARGVTPHAEQFWTTPSASRVLVFAPGTLPFVFVLDGHIADCIFHGLGES